MVERLLNRNFVLLWQGQLVSQLGNQAFYVAMMYWLMEATGSASLMGLLMMVSLLPGVILGPFGGALADRHSRLRIIVTSDLIHGFLVVGFAVLMFVRPENTGAIVTALFWVALLSGLLNAVFQPAITAAIPDLVPPDKVATGNSLNQFSSQASLLVGQAAGGILYRTLGAPFLFLIDGITYFVSAFSEAFIKIPQKRPEEKLSLRDTVTAYRRDTAEGIRYVWQRPGMRSFLLLSAGVNFFAMPIIVLLPFYVTERLGKGAEWYGFLLAGLGAGSLLGYLFTAAVQFSSKRRPAVIVSALLALAVALAMVGLTSSPVLALLLFVGAGIFTGVINIFVLTLFQITTPGEMRGRVMALVIAISSAAAPLGMALGGLLGDATGKNIPLIYLACATLIALLTVAASTRSPFRNFLAWEEGDEPS